MHPLPLALKQIFTAIFAAFGSMLGSFCNVVILRMAKRTSVVFPPSSCPHCNHKLSPLDLIPILGWIFLAGKCRYCRAPISIQYPLVETACAVTLAAAFHSAGFTPKLVPQAAWGVLWLVTSVLWFRGQIKATAPFVYPFVFRIVLELWAGKVHPETFAFSLVLAGFSTILVKTRNPELNWGSWFGCTGIGLISTLSYRLFPAILGIITLFQMAYPLPPKNELAWQRMGLFAWSICGMVLCAWQGSWGF